MCLPGHRGALASAAATVSDSVSVRSTTVTVSGPAAECLNAPLRQSCSSGGRGCSDPERVTGVVGGGHTTARSQLADQCGQPRSAQSDSGLEAEQWSLHLAGGCHQGI